MSTTYCPNCDAAITVSQPRVGAMVTCRECETELEVISVSPFELDFPLEYDQDWDDDWDDDDDDEED